VFFIYGRKSLHDVQKFEALENKANATTVTIVTIF
jgi:hypothetical protein